MKRIFTSQNNFNLGRGRSIRQLEAQLDRQGKKDGRSLLAKHLESRSIAGEEHLQQYMPDIADTHPAHRQDKLELENNSTSIKSKIMTFNSNSSPAHTLGESAKDNSTLSFTPQEPLLFCNYLESCNKACFQDTDKYNLCQIRKFKNKWGDDYEKFGKI